MNRLLFSFAREIVNLSNKQEVLDIQATVSRLEYFAYQYPSNEGIKEVHSYAFRFLAKLMIRNNLYLFRRMFLEKLSDSIQHVSCCKISFEQMHHLHR